MAQLGIDYEITTANQTFDTTGAGPVRDVFEVGFSTIPEGALGTVRVPIGPGWETQAINEVGKRVDEIKRLFASGPPAA